MPRTRHDGLSGRSWRITAPEDAPPIPDLDAPPFVGRLLRRRGITNAAQAQIFLDPESPLPAAPLVGLDRAVQRILRAARSGETAAVYGDYDVDGVTATAILYEALREVGIRSLWFIPHRRDDGYGLHEAQLERLAGEGASLVITADCGITANDAIHRAADRFGLEFVIVDHHAPSDTLPEAAAILAPGTEDPQHPFAELSTGGLAYHLAQALMREVQIETASERWLDLAALSTIADVVPLIGENRRIVSLGLRSLQRINRPGLHALAQLGPRGPIDAEAVSFRIAPRINAAGRLEHASLAVELLLSADDDEAKPLAARLERLNRKRRQLSDQAWTNAQEEIESQSVGSSDQCIAMAGDRPLERTEARSVDGALPLVLFAGSGDAHPGVIGIVAGRMQDRYQRPCFALSIEQDVAQASGRAPAPYDLAAMLAECSDLLLRHGGHARAAAFTAETRRLPALLERLNACAEASLSRSDAPPPLPSLKIDGQVSLHTVAPGHVHWIERLQPFGAANPVPCFVSEDVVIESLARIGADKSHLRLRVAPRHPSWRAGDWPAVAFRQGSAPLHAGQRVDLVWSLRRNRNRTPELEIHDFAPRP